MCWRCTRQIAIHSIFKYKTETLSTHCPKADVEMLRFQSIFFLFLSILFFFFLSSIYGFRDFSVFGLKLLQCCCHSISCADLWYDCINTQRLINSVNSFTKIFCGTCFYRVASSIPLNHRLVASFPPNGDHARKVLYVRTSEAVEQHKFSNKRKFYVVTFCAQQIVVNCISCLVNLLNRADWMNREYGQWREQKIHSISSFVIVFLFFFLLRFIPFRFDKKRNWEKAKNRSKSINFPFSAVLTQNMRTINSYNLQSVLLVLTDHSDCAKKKNRFSVWQNQWTLYWKRNEGDRFGNMWRNDK